MFARRSRGICLSVLASVILTFICIWPGILRGSGYNAPVSTEWVEHGGSSGPAKAPQLSAAVGTEVIGLVFYGRRAFVRVLDCYLKRNLRENGGVLDQVIFSVRTDDVDDLAYLDALIDTHPKYAKYVSGSGYKRYVGSWEAVKNPEAIYIKIDDDVVFVDDGAIAALTKRLEDNPQYFAVSANVVNNPALSWVHHGLGVYEPFWPEIAPPEALPPTTWRTSTLPSFDGPPDGPPGFSKNGSTPAPYEGHRWLPHRPPSSGDITSSPASTLTYDPYGPGLLNWAAAAQTHSSFLSHLEKNETEIYQFNKWDFAYVRVSINFLAIRGRDVMDVFPFPEADDEEYLTCTRPKEVGRHVIVDGSALAVHFAFRSQRVVHGGRGVGWTNLLDRYADYAAERVCPFPTREYGVIP